MLVCASLLTTTLKGPTLALVFSSFSASFLLFSFAIATLSPSDYHVSSGRSRALRGGGGGGGGGRGGQQEQNRFPLLTFSFLTWLTHFRLPRKGNTTTTTVCLCCDGACFDCCRTFSLWPSLFFTLWTGLVTDVRSLSLCNTETLELKSEEEEDD